ncbi:MAG TPA: phage holin family protein [Paucimonas sp.]|nr:phage holin family protein [Paucimonas sp.]
MGFTDSVARLVATFIAVVQTRAELATIEIEEEALRYFTYLMMGLAAMFFAGVTVLLAILLVVALFWDEHRIGVLLTLIVLFGIAAAAVGLKLRERYRRKPSLLGNTLVELSRDVEALKAPS